MEQEINANDLLLLELCKDGSSVNELSRELNISPPAISRKIEKLEKMKMVEIEKKGVGRLTIVKTINPKIINENQKKVLKAINYWSERLINKKIPCVPEKIKSTLDILDEKIDFPVEDILFVLQKTKKVGYLITKQGMKFFNKK